MTQATAQGRPGRRSDLPVAELELDAHLRRTVRRTSFMRQGFYVVVLLVALAGQVSGAVEALRIPLIAAVPAVAALELGGIVVLANADVRRRLGERAVASRLLSVAIAAGAVAFNWLAHENHLLGGFFAGMSALGYLVWLMHTENQRRDRLRAKGDLPPTTPAYEVVDHWLRHPMLTRRAKSLAKADSALGLYDSLAAARNEVRRERRQAAISKVLHRKIRSAVDPNTADIAVAVYDLDEIATRLADGADYDGLTALIAADLAPARLGLESVPAPVPAAPSAALLAPTAEVPALAAAPREAPPTGVVRSAPVPVLEPSLRRDLEDRLGRPRQAEQRQTEQRQTEQRQTEQRQTEQRQTEHRQAEHRQPEQRQTEQRQAEQRQTEQRQADQRQLEAPAVPAAASPGDEPARRERSRRGTGSARTSPSIPTDRPAPPTGPSGTGGVGGREGSLRRRVHTALDAHVPAGDQRDDSELIELVVDVLDLDDLDRLTAANYVHSWTREGSRAGVPAVGPA